MGEVCRRAAEVWGQRRRRKGREASKGMGAGKLDAGHH